MAKAILVYAWHLANTTGSRIRCKFTEQSILFWTNLDDPTIRVIAMKDYFGLLLEIYEQFGYGDRDKWDTVFKINFTYKSQVLKFFSLCPTCDLKCNLPKKGIVTKPIIYKDFNVRGQVDLSDFQSIRNINRCSIIRARQQSSYSWDQ